MGGARSDAGETVLKYILVGSAISICIGLPRPAHAKDPSPIPPLFEPISYAEVAHYSRTIPLGLAHASIVLPFTIDLSGGYNIATFISIHDEIAFTAYSSVPEPAGPGVISFGQTNVTYDMSAFGLGSQAHSAGYHITCPSICSGVSDVTTFSSSYDYVTGTGVNTNLGSALGINLQGSQISLSGGAQSIGTSTVSGVVTLNRTDDIFVGLEPPPVPEPITKKEFHDALGRLLDISGNGWAIYADEAAGCVSTPAAALACAGIGTTFGITAAIVELSDPIDLDFQEIALPEIVPLANLPSDFLSNPDLNGNVGSMIVDLDTLAALALATQTAMNRATGANSVGEYGYEQLQYNAAAYWLRKERIYAAKLGNNLISISSDIPEDRRADLLMAGEGLKTFEAVPEPATWMITLLGFAGTGAMLRRRALRSPAIS